MLQPTPPKEQLLREAAAVGDVGKMSSLLAEDGIDIDAVDDNGWSALHWCVDPASNLQLRAAALLLERGASPNARDTAGWTPLFWCIDYGPGTTAQRRMARLLLERGADPAARDRDGRTPLDWAREYENERTAALLEAAVAQRAPSTARSRAEATTAAAAA